MEKGVNLLSWLSICLVALLGAEAVPGTSGYSVSVDVTGLDQKTFDDYALAEFYKSLLVRIVQENLTAVDAGGRAQIEVSLGRKDRRILIVVKASRFHKTAAVELHKDNLADLHLQLIHETLELIRGACQELEKLPKSMGEEAAPPAGRPPQKKEEKKAVVRPQASKSPATVICRPSPYRLSIGLGTLGVWNPDNFGFMLATNAGFSADSGLGVDLGFGILSPVGLDEEISVIEWGLSVGANYRFILIPDLLFWDFGLAAGIWQHLFEYRGTGDYESKGDRLDFFASGTTRLAVGVGLGFEIQALAGVLFNPRERVHRVADRDLYHASRARGMFGILLAYRIRL